MKKINVVTRPPQEAEYKEIIVYDNLDDYLKNYNDGKDFVRTGFQNWGKKEIDSKNYYYFRLEDCWHTDFKEVITEEVYNKILKYSKKTFKIYERDLDRTEKNSNTRFTGDLNTPEEVINYMKDKDRSWLPQIEKEINEDIDKLNVEINNLKSKIDGLKKLNEKLNDEEYLKSKIKIDYTFDSQYYKSIIKNLEK